MPGRRNGDHTTMEAVRHPLSNGRQACGPVGGSHLSLLLRLLMDPPPPGHCGHGHLSNSARGSLPHLQWSLLSTPASLQTQSQATCIPVTRAAG